MNLLGIRGTDDQIRKKRYHRSNGNFLENTTSFAQNSHVKSKTAVFHFIKWTQALNMTAIKPCFEMLTVLKNSQ